MVTMRWGLACWSCFATSDNSTADEHGNYLGPAVSAVHGADGSCGSVMHHAAGEVRQAVHGRPPSTTTAMAVAAFEGLSPSSLLRAPSSPAQPL